MASTTQAEPPSLAMVAKNAPAVAMDAKLMVAADRGDCQRLKDLLNKEDISTMVMVMASDQTPAAKPSPASMHPLLLAAACNGDREKLHHLLNCRSLAKLRSSDDVEEGANMQTPSAASLLEDVTVGVDTVLHVVAANGDGDNFKECATFIKDMAKHLLLAVNNNGDTPLHCAARTGKSQMVSHLINLARSEYGDNIVKDLLRKENESKETVLHEAVRIGDNPLVELLLTTDSELARFPVKGSSPLYLAVLLEKEVIAQTLHDKSKDKDLSYLGPNEQNALHAAVLRSKGLTEKLLGWNKDLAKERDENGSTPLHFAAATPVPRWRRTVGCLQVFNANPDALYQSDCNGLFPVHVAASVGEWSNVAMFVKRCPSSAGLRDAKGRTFLQVAVEKKKRRLVSYACSNRSLAWIWNLQDNDGNTALHQAVQEGSLFMFRALLGRREVSLNLTNAKGQNPLDIARYKIPPGMHYNLNPANWIHLSLVYAGAKNGVSREDHFNEKYEDIHRVKSDYDIKELDNLKDLTQNLSIGSVLIATVTFGATFALPGGYIQDDHPNGGTPTLAGSYAFDAFMMANALAFICSSIATFGLRYSGTSMVHLTSRKVYLRASSYFMETSITALTAAFALGVYTVLAPVARKTAIGICAMSPLVVLSKEVEFWWKLALLLRPYWIRRGPVRTFGTLSFAVGVKIFLKGWPLLFILLLMKAGSVGGYVGYPRRPKLIPPLDVYRLARLVCGDGAGLASLAEPPALAFRAALGSARVRGFPSEEQAEGIAYSVLPLDTFAENKLKELLIGFFRYTAENKLKELLTGFFRYTGLSMQPHAVQAYQETDPSTSTLDGNRISLECGHFSQDYIDALKEISETLVFEPGQKSTDRADIVVRVYHMKLEELLEDIKKGVVFGPINAEIPDPKLDPLGYVLVAEHMTHGPCGETHQDSPCMKNNKCSKRYPKPFHAETTIDENGFAIYKRSDNNMYIQKGNVKFNNRWIVPYNMHLLKKFQAHINVEWCNKSIFIKYLFKYVTKGPDCGKVYIEKIRNGQDVPYDDETQTTNEVKEYLDCRYICEQDACWRIFGFDIHRHFPSVERLPVHLPNENNITYNANANLADIISVEFLRRTMLTEWFTANQIHPQARQLTYCEFPSKWRWDETSRAWKPRQIGTKIGRLYYVHPSVGERYYLRMLLMVVKGAQNYDDVKTHNGVTYATFKEACNARGLLGDDQEWYNAFDEAASWATSAQLRQLFVTMLLFCEVNDEHTFFEKVWRALVDDIQYRFRQVVGNPSYQLSDNELRDYLLDDLSTLFAKNGGRMRDYNLPHRSNPSHVAYGNRLIDEELSYDNEHLLLESDPLLSNLNDEQRQAFDTITNAVLNNTCGFFFVSGYGGTGKTYLWNAIVAYL
ncbi:uncharacterized protein LOC133896896 [Phragmites australis]|uniref:uncharacterized protein LOC133896896 n=1 Tax=Phragmites australis TaxID=29695 RepID=UPI002D798B93|nr:uncharacterized protein LOC133896896 [Phragmites australis]